MTDAADELIPGFAFLPTAEPIPHLTFVASYPNDDDEVVILSFTTRRDYSDSSVIVTTTDHAWLKHESVVDFGKARLEPRALLHRSLTLGLIQRRDALSSILP